MNAKSTILSACLAGLALLAAACGPPATEAPAATGNFMSDVGAPMSTEAPAATEAAAFGAPAATAAPGEPAAPGGVGQLAFVLSAARMVIKDAELELLVADIERAIRQV